MTQNNREALKMELHTIAFKYFRYYGECEMTLPEADHEAELLADKMLVMIEAVEEKYQDNEIV